MAYYCIDCDEPCEPVGDIELDGDGDRNEQYRCVRCQKVGIAKIRSHRISDLDGLKEVPPP